MASEMVATIAKVIAGSEEYDAETRAVAVLEHLQSLPWSMVSAGHDYLDTLHGDMAKVSAIDMWCWMIKSALEAHYAQ